MRAHLICSLCTWDSTARSSQIETGFGYIKTKSSFFLITAFAAAARAESEEVVESLEDELPMSSELEPVTLAEWGVDVLGSCWRAAFSKRARARFCSIRSRCSWVNEVGRALVGIC
jgi:hypothetical protein